MRWGPPEAPEIMRLKQADLRQSCTTDHFIITLATRCVALGCGSVAKEACDPIPLFVDLLINHKDKTRNHVGVEKPELGNLEQTHPVQPLSLMQIRRQCFFKRLTRLFQKTLELLYLCL